MAHPPGDSDGFGPRYAAAWSSHDPGAVASFYEPDGRIAINDAEPLVGRTAIAAMAAGFFAAYPDLVLEMVAVDRVGDDAVFLWSLRATHGETGRHVLISGWEAWRLSPRGLVQESRGRYDEADLARQVAGSGPGPVR